MVMQRKHLVLLLLTQHFLLFKAWSLTCQIQKLLFVCFNRLNDDVGTMMLPLSRFRATSHLASIWPLLAGDIAYFRCFPLLLKHAQLKERQVLSAFLLLRNTQWFSFCFFGFSCNTRTSHHLTPSRSLASCKLSVSRDLHKVLMLTEVNR